MKTGEKMVPSRVVRGGLLVESTGASSLPFGLIGLLWQVMVSFEGRKKKGEQILSYKLQTKYLCCFLYICILLQQWFCDCRAWDHSRFGAGDEQKNMVLVW